MNDERIDELLALAALGELSTADARELDAAIAADPSIAAELDADLAAAAGIQRAAAEPPPIGLKATVLDAIADVEQDDDAADRATGPAGGSRSAGPTTGAEVVPIRRDRRLTMRPLLAAAAVIALVVGGVVVARSGTDSSTTVEAVIEAPDARARSLAGELTGSLRVVHSAAEDAFVLDGADVAGLGPDRTYQLWFVDEAGTATSVGLFRPSDDGRVLQRFDDLDPTGFVVGVTIEPSGGSETPTLPIIAAA